VKSIDLPERLNQEVRGSEKNIRIFPTLAPAIRLIGAILMDLYDYWPSSSRKYIKFSK